MILQLSICNCQDKRFINSCLIDGKESIDMIGDKNSVILYYYSYSGVLKV